MPGLRPDIDPDGLLEYSVVFTDRSLNHMSKAFQHVMRDIHETLCEVYHADRAVVVPGGGTFAMEAVARQFATNQKVLVIRNGFFLLSLDADLRSGIDPVAGDRDEGAPHRQWWHRCAVHACADRRSGGDDPRREARRRVRPACRDRIGHDPAGRLSPRARRRRPRGRRAVRARLHRLGLRLGRHAGNRRRHSDFRAGKRAGPPPPARGWS